MMKKLPKFLKSNAGFSFVEILVAVSIFAILCVIALLNFSVVSQKTRDAKRVEDLLGIRSALELYRLEAGSYPDSLPGCDDSLSYNGVIFMEKVPCDPETGLPYGYYKKADGRHYVVGAQTELAQTGNQECEELNIYLGLVSPSPSVSASVAPSASPSPAGECLAEGESSNCITGGGEECLSCCSGLTGVGILSWNEQYGCIGITGYVCTRCGDGNCGTGENICNCPADCSSPSPSPSPTEEQLVCETSGGSWIAGGCDPCDGSPCREVMTYGCDCGSNGCWSGGSCIFYSEADKANCEANDGTWTLFSDDCADTCGVHEMCAQEENMNCDCATFDTSYCWDGITCSKTSSGGWGD